jgi:hypothetical protein
MLKTVGMCVVVVVVVLEGRGKGSGVCVGGKEENLGFVCVLWEEEEEEEEEGWVGKGFIGGV